MMLRSVLFVSILFLGRIGLAGEPDNFSARMDNKAVNANPDINRVVNTVLDMAIAEYTPRNQANCDRKRLVRYLEDQLDRNMPRIYQSVYVNTPIAGPRKLGELPYRKGLPYTELYYSPSYKVSKDGKEYFIGLDKIDHFFSHGSMYWEIINQDPELPIEKVNKALDIGLQQESATWGLQRTGVKSYGDLSANYHGLMFWRDLFDGKPPLVKCEDGFFKRVGNFDIEKYFDESMDESVNCNSYASSEVLQSLISVNEKRNLKCPIDVQACQQLTKKYPANIAKKILHPRCLGLKHNQIEEASPMSTKDVIQAAQAAMGGGGNFLLFKLFGEKLNDSNTKQKGVK